MDAIRKFGGLKEAGSQSQIYSSFEQTNKELIQKVLGKTFGFGEEDAKRIADSGPDYVGVLEDLKGLFSNQIGPAGDFLSKFQEAREIYNKAGEGSKDIGDLEKTINGALDIAAKQKDVNFAPKTGNARKTLGEDVLGDFKVLSKQTYENLSRVRYAINSGTKIGGVLAMSLDSARKLMEDCRDSSDKVKSGNNREFKFEFGRDSIELSLVVTDALIKKAADTVKEKARLEEEFKGTGYAGELDAIEKGFTNKLETAIPNEGLRKAEVKDLMDKVRSLRTAQEKVKSNTEKEYNKIC